MLVSVENSHSAEIENGKRYAFGENWWSFLNTLDDDRIAKAENSLLGMLGVNSLVGLSFLDVGCGSGLFSLAAYRLGANVHSLDYDPASVACARTLKERYDVDKQANEWTVEEGSALDVDYIKSLGRYDIVYSWGVLHHTGNMYLGLENISIPVKMNGKLFIAIYNDQGNLSNYWRRVKKMYCSGKVGRTLITALFFPYYSTRSGVLGVLGVLRYGNPMGHANAFRKNRGMSISHDRVDWLGGYPFEVAKPEELIEFYRKKDYVLEKLVSTNRNGCNQFVFRSKG